MYKVKKASLSDFAKGIIELIGENPSREGLRKTPLRYAQAMAEMTSGYSMDLDSVVNNAVYPARNKTEMVLVKDIPFASVCEHHMLPFIGRAQVAYLPQDKIIGLSKIPRIVNMYARRLQVQENLTQQIAEALERIVKPKGVAIYLEARHMCMEIRGVKSTGSTMVTNVFRGHFQKSRARWEFINIVGGKK